MKLSEFPKWLPVIVTGCAAIALLWNLPKDVMAMKAEVQQIQKYIVQDKKKEVALDNAFENAPPGWRWERGLSQYVAWPEDPRLDRRRGEETD